MQNKDHLVLYFSSVFCCCCFIYLFEFLSCLQLQWTLYIEGLSWNNQRPFPLGMSMLPTILFLVVLYSYVFLNRDGRCRLLVLVSALFNLLSVVHNFSFPALVPFCQLTVLVFAELSDVCVCCDLI